LKEKEWTWLFSRRISNLMRLLQAFVAFVEIPRQVSLLRQVPVDAVHVSDAVRATGNLASRRITRFYTSKLSGRLRRNCSTAEHKGAHKDSSLKSGMFFPHSPMESRKISRAATLCQGSFDVMGGWTLAACAACATSEATQRPFCHGRGWKGFLPPRLQVVLCTDVPV